MSFRPSPAPLSLPPKYGMDGPLVQRRFMPHVKTIIVTGCSSGIGAHCARALQTDGWRVFATVRKPEDLAALEADGIEALPMDYTRPETITSLVATVRKRTGERIDARSEEHTSELQSLMRISYAVFCLKK